MRTRTTLSALYRQLLQLDDAHFRDRQVVAYIACVQLSLLAARTCRRLWLVPFLPAPEQLFGGHSGDGLDGLFSISTPYLEANAPILLAGESCLRRQSPRPTHEKHNGRIAPKLGIPAFAFVGHNIEALRRPRLVTATDGLESSCFQRLS
jgi:hypothetical protein